MVPSPELSSVCPLTSFSYIVHLIRLCLEHMGPKGDIPARCHAHVAYASPEQAQKVVNARRANGNKLPRAWQHRRVFFNVHPTYGSTSRAWAFVKHRGQPGDVSAQQIAEALKMGVDDVELCTSFILPSLLFFKSKVRCGTTSWDFCGGKATLRGACQGTIQFHYTRGRQDANFSRAEYILAASSEPHPAV